ncbi:acyl carrier protein [Actinoplanes sp. L3-i22]|uniref:acyl carrier protein n=1 Tax=Actinoplanes sp. L3-i22 TaxID=2836373 RepID=UPI001C798F5D|nr:acyl carrier protein [Actinoplanes sp. L3-i22]BCY09807.1 hypothetical protein L3i22_048950 [Actinoplanes sp. L3-i22]
MAADDRPFVIAVSGHDDESLTARARDLSRYLRESRRETVAFAHAVTLPGVAKTLLCGRETGAHRLSFSAGSVGEVAERLQTYLDRVGDCRALVRDGIYRNTVECGVFDEPDDDGDRAYAAGLAARGRHRQLARLWAVGYPVDWVRVYPELAGERPVYLPPTRSSRRRYWPTAERVEPAPPVVGDVREVPALVRQQRLRDYLQQQIAGVLGYPAGELPRTETGFFDLGMTSIHLEAVRSAIVRDLAVEPELSAAFDHPTITQFVHYLSGRLDGGPAPSALAELDDQEIESLSAIDLERLLSEVV